MLRDGDEIPPERLLQAIWLHQRFYRDRLKTIDGKKIRIFHPGFPSFEGGPDFRNAVIQIGDAPPQSGDVEIDLQSNGWHAHGHDRNANFKNVVLHVVWGEGQPVPGVLATMSIHDVLDAPLRELGLRLENEPAGALPKNLCGRCSATLRRMEAVRLEKLLLQAAQIRFEAKAAAILARARHGGWEQALWEQLFRALGYKHNAWPMQNLAEMRTRWLRNGGSTLELQARLLGIGGLLPSDLTRSQRLSDSFLRHAWDCWWRERDTFAGCQLPKINWRFHGLRPANHPQRRLALASHWLASGDLISKIEAWCVKDLSEPKLLVTLHKILNVDHDEFWSWHWTFNSAQLENPQPLLGAARVTDLAVNVILPWLWVRAREGGNEKIRREMERRYFAWPPAEDNSVLKLARQRLLETHSRKMLNGAATQQGLMQIVRDFCEHSNAICNGCRFPELADGWCAGTTANAVT